MWYAVYPANRIVAGERCYSLIIALLLFVLPVAAAAATNRLLCWNDNIYICSYQFTQWVLRTEEKNLIFGQHRQMIILIKTWILYIPVTCVGPIFSLELSILKLTTMGFNQDQLSLLREIYLRWLRNEQPRGIGNFSSVQETWNNNYELYANLYCTSIAKQIFIVKLNSHFFFSLVTFLVQVLHNLSINFCVINARLIGNVKAL